MKKILLSALALFLVLAGQMRADLYNFTFAESAGGPSTAAGQIDVVSGFATTGYLDVTGGPGLGHYDYVIASGTVTGTSSAGTTLYSSPLNFFSTDSVVYVDANPFLTEGGLLFSNGTKEFNLFYSDVDAGYILVGSDGFTATGRRHFDPVALGSATLSAVPESGTTVALLGAALLGFAAFRRRFVN